MKKIVSLFILVTAFASCGEDVTFNSPAFEANKNGNLWKANSMQAIADASGVTIFASVGTDIVTLHINSSSPGVYPLGTNDINTATFMSTDGEGVTYETGAGIGSGEIEITPNQTAGTITGTFEFVAEDEDGNEVVFRDGNFYKIPR
jgi:uncharacterized protein DUF6252